MNLPALALIILLAAIVLSVVTRLNLGGIATVLAFGVGIGVAGLPVGEIAAGFPLELFFTLIGVTFLFGHAQANGTLENIVRTALAKTGGLPALLPWSIYGIAAFLSAIGAGNIAATAILAPLAMALPTRGAQGAFLMAIMVANGANAGALSPLAPTGLLLATKLSASGLAGLEWSIFLNTLLLSTLIAGLGYGIFRGARAVQPTPAPTLPAWTPSQRATLAVLTLTILLATVTVIPLAALGVVGGAILGFFPSADHQKVIKGMPWPAIAMVCGMVLYVALVEKLGGLSLLVDLTARHATAANVVGLSAFAAGLASVFSSSSAVVMPTFLPLVPELLARVGGGDATALATSIVVSAHLVDVSPLSTLGALCIAAIPGQTLRRGVFYRMLAWGLAMALVGALVCHVWFKNVVIG